MIDFGQGMNPNTCALILGTKFDDELLLMQVYSMNAFPFSNFVYTFWKMFSTNIPQAFLQLSGLS